jgi:hypothetical protein
MRGTEAVRQRKPGWRMMGVLSAMGSTGVFVRTVRVLGGCKWSGGRGLAEQKTAYENRKKGGTVRTVREGKATLTPSAIFR